MAESYNPEMGAEVDVAASGSTGGVTGLTAATPNRLRHIPELDGIRGLAALAVFFHHVCNSTLLVDQQPGWPRLIHLLSRVSLYGDRGVDLFFVLSGFLITSILLQERRSPRYYHDFYWKRALRILPLYLVTLACMLIFLHQIGYVALSLVFLVNFASVIHISGDGPFWTLAIEEQFYLLWPTVVRRKTVAQVRRWAISLAAMAFVLRILFALRGHHNYYLTFLRCDGLAFGALLACHFHVAGTNEKLRRSWDSALAVLAVAGLVVLFWPTLDLARAMDNVAEQTGAVLVTGSVIGLAISRTGASALAPLRSSVLTFFGLISYAFYMVHLFILERYDAVRGPLAAGNVREYWLRLAVLFGGAVAASVLSRYAIELPAMRLRRFVLGHPTPDAERAHPPLPLAPM